MRIAVDATAIPSRRTGAGNYIFNLVQGLAQIDQHNEYVIFAKRKHVNEFAINQSNFRFVGVDFPSRSIRLLWEQIGLPWHILRFKIDILHSPHYTMPLPKMCKSIVTFCDMTFYLLPEMHGTLKRFFFQAMMKWSARHADKLIAISENTRQDVIRLLNAAPERIVSVPLAANVDYQPLPEADVENVCARYNLTPGQYIYYVGVLEPRKNIPALIEAYAQLAAQFPDVPLIIAGKKGWMYEEIFRRVVELGLDNRVRFLGYIPDSDLVGLYNGARVFVYPSRYEGFGLPVLEAMQCGTPVITSNVSSMPEVAQDGALMVRPDNVADLCNALYQVLADARLANELSNRGLAQSTRFSWRRCAQETLQVYQSVC